MKKILVFLACFAATVSFVYSSPQEEYYSYSYAQLSYVKGDVFVHRGEDLGYEEGVINLALVEGDKLGTQEGRTEVHFGKKNYLRLNSFTQIDLVDLPQRGNDLIKLHLLSGEIFLRINFLKIEKGFEIHTPDASFYILEEGLYRFEVRENEATELSVYEGSVEAAGEEGSLLVEGRERLIAAKGHFQSDPEYFHASYEDSFASWNRSRDALHNRVVARRYLPSELYDYEVELAYNGRWVYERPYGYVWIPHHIYHDWRPYYYGRWVWYPIIGWNWVSYEPWGWGVYHYGRWHWRLGLGWYWIPTRYWGPAWVHWYHGYDYVGWCPLSYYGYPVVIVNNHFYGRYYNRHYPLHSRALTVVHRRQLQAPRISRVALSQSHINRLGKISLSSRQPSIRPALNKSRTLNSRAAKAFSRANIRTVHKGYLSGKTSNSISRLRPIHSETSRSISARSSPSDRIKTRLTKSGERASSKSPVSIYKRSSNTTSKNQATSRDVSSRPSSVTRSGLRIKTYPSKQRTANSYRSKLTSSSSYRSRIGSYGSPSRVNSRSSLGSGNTERRSVRQYTSRSQKSVSSSPSSRGYVQQRSNYTKDSYRGSRTTSTRPQSYNSSRSTYTRSPKSYSYTSPSRSYVSSRSSSRYTSPSRSRVSSYSRSTYTRSPRTYSYTSPSRSYVSSRSSSRYTSPSRSRVSSSSRSTYTRSPKTYSYSSPSRSYVSSRSSSRYTSPSRSRVSSSRSYSSGTLSRSSSSRSSSSSSSRHSSKSLRRR